LEALKEAVQYLENSIPDYGVNYDIFDKSNAYRK